jgi:CubicO group peptidase (beta-lactamase class C family)
MESISPENVGFSSERLERIGPMMQAYVDRKELPGLITLIARKGKIVHFGKFGLMDIETNKPMQADTIFRIYSMTKPIVSVATMMLVEEGRLMLGDPVGKYLPAFANQSVLVERDGRFDLEPAQRETTVHDLLRHTSGLTYEFLGTGPVHQRYVEAR